MFGVRVVFCFVRCSGQVLCWFAVRWVVFCCVRCSGQMLCCVRCSVGCVLLCSLFVGVQDSGVKSQDSGVKSHDSGVKSKDSDVKS